MQDKKVIALIVLTILAVISLIYGATAPAKGKANYSPASGSQVAAGAPSGSNNVIMASRRAKRSQFKAWKRNPFATGQSASTTELVLNGVIWNKVKPKAMIGDAIVTTGDTIGEYKVVDIQPKKVILNDGTKDVELKMEK